MGDALGIDVRTTPRRWRLLLIVGLVVVIAAGTGGYRVLHDDDAIHATRLAAVQAPCSIQEVWSAPFTGGDPGISGTVVSGRSSDGFVICLIDVMAPASALRVFGLECNDASRGSFVWQADLRARDLSSGSGWVITVPAAAWSGTTAVKLVDGDDPQHDGVAGACAPVELTVEDLRQLVTAVPE